MTLHWLMLLLIVAVYVCILLTDIFPKGSDTRVLLKTWHFMLGLTILAPLAVRLIVKWVSPAPLIEPPLAHWQNITAKAVQSMLYALMFCMPLLGWLTLSADGQPIPFYGWELPALIAQSKDLVESLKSIHEAGATIIYFLVGIHAMAALYHHYFLRDNTLRQMLP